MHRSTPSRLRARILVPPALVAVILTGAVAPAVAADGETAASLRTRVAAAQQKVEQRRAAAPAGPIDDLLTGISATLEGLLQRLQGLLPGITLPPIRLPALPAVPAAPAVPAVPAVPPVPELPVTIPGVPVTVPPADSAPVAPGIPEIPDIPEIPEIPEVPDVPALP
ncbi:hypothetical protein ACFV7Q_32515 [Streptomyces sp. NPDC059851]|uniref:hypothetical protein n=1 Tax=Streptomyces sp. NPDC059851 TaxID=3346971 RepID=UPI00366747F8